MSSRRNSSRNSKLGGRRVIRSSAAPHITDKSRSGFPKRLSHFLIPKTPPSLPVQEEHRTVVKARELADSFSDLKLEHGTRLSLRLDPADHRVVMDHRVTVRTNRAQVLNRINFILVLNLGKRLEMVDVNESSTTLAKDLLEIEVADGATRTVMLDALLASVWILLH